MNLLNHCFFNNIVNGLIYVLVFGDTNFLKTVLNILIMFKETCGLRIIFLLMSTGARRSYYSLDKLNIKHRYLCFMMD